MTLYRLSDLKRTHGHRTVLNIPFLDIEEGLIYALRGANGAGKTSLLEILAFLDPPSSGNLFYKDRRIRFSSRSSLAALRKEVALVDQNPILFTGSVYSNVAFGLKARKIEKKKIREMVEQTLEMVGMSDFIHEKAHRLSGGETQRVALARAIALSPKVLLCDEPTSSVDADSRTAIIDILRQTNREKKSAIIFTTHDPSLEIAHKTITLDYGKIVARTDEATCARLTRHA